ncbi:hypothetical protein AVEN_98638-1 [Araneus ventricosus]|uniref:Uncharacterized protein n=1 Tax=Araneus ventricosus TaxID=182803 RepID=A0A4Y2QZ13_ARAVE|nr:hypothetical protein AVEN_98638-1 [Araneus ventricosus]
MKSFLSLQKFQEDDTQLWAANYQQRKEPLFSCKSHSGARNRLSPASVEWGGLRRDRAHRVKRRTHSSGTDMLSRLKSKSLPIDRVATFESSVLKKMRGGCLFQKAADVKGVG